MNITSEIAPLKKAIIHRPTDALKRLTPENCHNYLFDDVLWPEKAAEEHLAFEKILQTQGVEVYLLENLLKETLDIPEAKEELITKTLNLRFARTKVKTFISQYLHHLDSTDLAKLVVGMMIKGATTTKITQEIDYIKS